MPATNLETNLVRVRSLEFNDMDTMARTLIGNHMDFVPLRALGIPSFYILLHLALA